MAKREKIIKLTSVLISLSFCLLIIELVLRGFYPQISQHDSMFQYDADLGWSFIPDRRGAIVYPGAANHFIQINETGFRDSSFEGMEDKKKVMVIGDSFVSNVSVKNGEVFTEVLEAGLEEMSVMNFGVNGYGQVQELLMLQKWVDKFRPDLVILMVYVRNDFGDNVGQGQWDYDKPIAYWQDSLQSVKIGFRQSPKGKVGTQAPAKSLFYHKLHLYHFVKRSVRNIDSKYFSDTEEDILPYQPQELFLCKKEPSSEMHNMQKVMETLILQFSSELKSRDTEFALAIAPSMIQVEDRLWNYMISKYTDDPDQYDRALPNSRLIQFANGNNIPALDLFKTLHRESKKGIRLYNRQEQHWTAEGNRIVADELHKFLKTSFPDGGY